MAHPLKFHPHTGQPLEPLYVTKAGRVMWPILGASPDDPAPDPTPAQEPAPSPAPEPAPAPGPDDGRGGKQAILDDLAKERGKRQELESRLTDFESKQQEQLDAIAKLVGLKTDEPADPTKLAEQIAAEQTATREAHRQLAVYRRAASAGANPDALLDSASFLRSIADVDPADQAAVDAAIKTAVDANAVFKATPPTPSFQGGPRPTPTPSGSGVLGDALKGRMAGRSS